MRGALGVLGWDTELGERTALFCCWGAELAWLRVCGDVMLFDALGEAPTGCMGSADWEDEREGEAAGLWVGLVSGMGEEWRTVLAPFGVPLRLPLELPLGGGVCRCELTVLPFMALFALYTSRIGVNHTYPTSRSTAEGGEEGMQVGLWMGMCGTQVEHRGWYVDGSYLWMSGCSVMWMLSTAGRMCVEMMAKMARQRCVGPVVVVS